MQDPHLHQRIGFQISRLARVMQTRTEAELAPLGLTRLGWVLLLGIGVDGIDRPSELARYTGITRPSISRALRRLEADGLIARTDGIETDGRIVRIVLTDHGREVLEIVRPRMDVVNRHFADKLQPEERALLFAALAKLAAGEPDVLTRL